MQKMILTHNISAISTSWLCELCKIFIKIQGKTEKTSKGIKSHSK